jgi:hypothetical protein
MSRTYIVKQGEHLAGIAAKHGFTNHRVIFDNPANAELKKLRPNPNILFPDDQVVIPDKVIKEVPKPTDKKHVFAVTLQELRFRVKVLNLSDEAFNGQMKLVAGTTSTDMEQKNNVHEAEIAPLVTEAKLQFEPAADKTQRADILLEVGSLDPITKQSGQRERLNNLAYFAGFSETPNPDQFRWAVEEFQADHRDSDGLRVTGVCDEQKTQPVLVKVYGM